MSNVRRRGAPDEPPSEALLDPLPPLLLPPPVGEHWVELVGDALDRYRIRQLILPGKEALMDGPPDSGAMLPIVSESPGKENK